MNQISEIEDHINFLQMTIDSPDTSVPNAIRRIILSEVPIYAIDVESIIIKKNNGIFNNEQLILNLSMIPVRNGFHDNYDTIKFKLSGTGPTKNKKNEVGCLEPSTVIYSDDIIPKGYFAPGVPITELRIGQILEIEEMKLKMSNCRDNASFQAGIVHYKIKESEKENVRVQLQIYPICHIDNIYYPLSPLAIVVSALEVINQKCITLTKTLEEKKNINSVVLPTGEKINTIILEDENDTIGHLLQRQLMRNDDFGDSFVGYRNIHPLINRLIIKFIHDKPDEQLNMAITKIQTEIVKLRDKLKG